jgi:DNA modification methylase
VDKDQSILIGDNRDVMRQIPDRSVHCIVTSPPYWGLRDYGIDPVRWADGWEGVFGNEPTIQQYITHTLELFEHFHRVLRGDGVVWWNIGDTYSPGGNKLLIPARVAIALQESGWVVRSDVQWVKPSPMPESIGGVRWERCKVKTGRQTVDNGGLSSWDMGEHSHGPSTGDYRGQEKTVPIYEPCSGCQKCQANGGYVLRQGRWRPTTAHEAIYMITKPGNYVCHALQVAEPASGASPGNKSHKGKTAYEAGDKKHRTKVGLTAMTATETRNPRSTWRISPEAYKEAHFATFPSELPYRCIKASTSDHGCCPHCGNQWVAIEESTRRSTRPGTDTKVDSDDGLRVGNRDPHRHVTVKSITGYRPTCKCPDHEPVPCTVLDPFVGSGTTLQVCNWIGRRGIGIDLGEHHRPLIEDRIQTRPSCLKGKDRKDKKAKARSDGLRQREMF